MPIINGQGRVAVRVTGITPAPSSSYLLDTYGGAAAAYSLRKLSNTYSGSAIRVRRSSDNTEQNIGFDGSGNLDTTALTSFVGAGNGFVTTWYDQSGNGKDATQTTASYQPQIVTSGVVNLKNGKPCVNFNGTSFRMQTSAISWGTSFTFTGVFNAIKTGGYSKLYQIGNDNLTGGYAFATFAGLTQLDWSVDDSVVFGNGYNTSSYPRIISNGRILNDNTQYTTFISLNSSSSNFYKNNTEISYKIQQPGNSVSASMILYLGSSEGLYGYQYFKGDLQEAIYYTSNQSSNRSGINSNINTYYSIYPTDADAAAFVSAAGITDSTQMSAVNTLVTSLKSAGIWNKMKAIYPFVGGTATSHKFNLKDPRDLDAAYRLVFNGGWTHSSTGAKPNGTNGFANTYLNPTTALSLNSAHISFNSRTSTASFQNQCIMGVQTGANLRMILNYSNNEGFECNSVGGGYSPSSFTDLKGFFITTRSTSTQFSYYLNSNLVRTLNTASALPNANVYLGSGNSFGSAFFYSVAESSFASIGDGLTSSEASALNTAVQAFQTTLGRQVA